MLVNYSSITLLLKLNYQEESKETDRVAQKFEFN